MANPQTETTGSATAPNRRIRLLLNKEFSPRPIRPPMPS
jgi:hypothetical protein